MSQTLQELKAAGASRNTTAPAVMAGFETAAGFEALQRMGKLFTCSTIVPTTFQGQNNIGNACIAIDMAIRMRANPLMVMQNLYIVYGRPAWSAQFLIATLNKSGKFSALRYAFQGKEGTDEWGCRAYATEVATGNELEGPLVTIALAKKEGWTGKNGSKWLTMPEMMLRYRAASWFVRTYAPEIAMGLPEVGELEDTIDVTPQGKDAQEAEPTISQAQIAQKAARKRSAKSAEEPPAPQEPETAETPQSQKSEGTSARIFRDHAYDSAEEAFYAQDK